LVAAGRVWLNTAASAAAMSEKATQAPQLPWSRSGVIMLTPPALRESQRSGSAASTCRIGAAVRGLGHQLALPAPSGLAGMRPQHCRRAHNRPCQRARAPTHPHERVAPAGAGVERAGQGLQPAGCLELLRGVQRPGEPLVLLGAGVEGGWRL
jgi:hypothetical protein